MELQVQGLPGLHRKIKVILINLKIKTGARERYRSREKNRNRAVVPAPTFPLYLLLDRALPDSKQLILHVLYILEDTRLLLDGPVASQTPFPFRFRKFLPIIHSLRNHNEKNP